MSVNAPRVSVVMATYNRAELLDRAIDSVLAQDFSDWELIVIDDGSSDATQNVLAARQHDHRIKVLVNESNLGLQASLNRGIEAATGEYLARIDDDDRWSDAAKLSKQLEFMEFHPDFGLLGTAYVDEQGQDAFNPLLDDGVRRQMLFRCPFCHASVLIRSEALMDAGHYDDSLAYAEDWDLWMRIGKRWKLGNLADICVHREQGPQTLSERYFNAQLRIAQELRRRHGSDYPGNFRAAVYHTLSRCFFALFPVGGRVHRFFTRGFESAFSLRG